MGTYIHACMHAYILACQSRASTTTNALSQRFITIAAVATVALYATVVAITAVATLAAVATRLMVSY